MNGTRFKKMLGFERSTSLSNNTYVEYNITTRNPITVVADGAIIHENHENKTTISSTISLNSTDEDNSGFILVPIFVFLGIIALSALVYLMARNRRRLAHIYCKRKSVPKYKYEENSSDSALEQNEDYDFDDPSECLLKGRLQIVNRHENYQTTQVTRNVNHSNELHT